MKVETLRKTWCILLLFCIRLRVKLLFETSGAETSVSLVIISPSMCRRKTSNAVWPFSSNAYKHPTTPWPIYSTTPSHTRVHSSWQFKSLHLWLLLLQNITAFFSAHAIFLALSSTTRQSLYIQYARKTKYIDNFVYSFYWMKVLKTITHITFKYCLKKNYEHSLITNNNFSILSYSFEPLQQIGKNMLMKK